MLVSAGSISTAATSPWASSRSRPSRSLNSATRLVCVTSYGAPTLPSRLRAHRRTDHDQRLVHRPVVAVAVDEDPRPAGDRADDPDRPPVGVRGGQREAPRGQPEPAGQVGADPLGVLGRQHRRRAAQLAEPALHRADDRLRGVPGHGGGVAEREVDVVVPVQVAHPAPRAPSRGRAGTRRPACSSTSWGPARTGARRTRTPCRSKGFRWAYSRALVLQQLGQPAAVDHG